MAQELTLAREKAGLGLLVAAATNIPGPDNAEYLTFLSQRANVHMVAAAAYYTQPSYPAGTDTIAEEELVEQLVRGAASARLGAFGELGVVNDAADLDPVERKVFRAFGRAQARTNLPIFTHNAYGTGPNVPRDAGLKQLDAFESVGVDPRRVAIGHTCCLDDPKAEIIGRIATRGAFVGFDRVTGGLVSDEKKVLMVMAFLDAGHADRLLLSADYNFTAMSAARPGYGSALTQFVPRLRKAGVSDATLRQITVENPRRFLAFVPATA